MVKEELEYSDKYGKLPDTREKLIEFFEATHKLDWKRIHDLEKHIAGIKWEVIHIELPIVPKATPRPRYSSSTGTFYVKGAKKTRKMIEKYLKGYPLICTRIEFDLEIYQPTPSGMSVSEAYLAEKGLILPLSKPDFDNVAKTYSDALQSLLLVNDNIINPGSIKKYYSIKPRVVINIRYQTDFDCNFNRRRILSSKGYHDLMIERSEDTPDA